MAKKAKPKRRATRPKPRAAKSRAKPKPKVAPNRKSSPKEARPKPAPVVRIAREEWEEETVCSIEFLQDNRSFIARMDTTKGGMREHRAPTFTDLLELVSEDLREEFSEA